MLACRANFLTQLATLIDEKFIHPSVYTCAVQLMGQVNQRTTSGDLVTVTDNSSKISTVVRDSKWNEEVKVSLKPPPTAIGDCKPKLRELYQVKM